MAFFFSFLGGQPLETRGSDNILPAVLEFREDTEDSFFSAITMGLDVNAVQFKLAPTYTIYMATRFRASTHYRPELIPEERAIRLTAMLDAVSDCIFGKFGYFLQFWGKFWFRATRPKLGYQSLGFKTIYLDLN